METDFNEFVFTVKTKSNYITLRMLTDLSNYFDLIPTQVENSFLHARLNRASTTTHRELFCHALYSGQNDKYINT